MVGSYGWISGDKKYRIFFKKGAKNEIKIIIRIYIGVPKKI